MMDAIAVFNAGSSSIKFSLFLTDGHGLAADLRGQIEGVHGASHFIAKDRDGALLAERRWDGVSLDHAAALAHIMEFLDTQRAGIRLVGVGHRVVHGGLDYARPVRVTQAVLEDLGKLIPLAPLHQRHNLAPVSALLARLPALPQVACFDTAFHRSNPDLVQRYALPVELHAAGIRRYGFHGLSYEYIASVLPGVDAQAAQGRCVVLHLGNGASMCALRGGKSIASTMGFSTLDGLPMGTRSGAIDPGVLLYLMDERGLDARALEALLYQRSGLLGMSGIAGDVRTLLASRDPAAVAALDVFVYRIGRELGSLAAALGGLDALVFTAGIGENAPSIRRQVCRDAAWLGLDLDEAANAAGEQRISTPSSRVSAWVLPTNEELMIARHTLRLLGAGAASMAEDSPQA